MPYMSFFFPMFIENLKKTTKTYIISHTFNQPFLRVATMFLNVKWFPHVIKQMSLVRIPLLTLVQKCKKKKSSSLYIILI